MSEKSVQLAYKIRRHALEMTNRGGTSHIGSIFSMADFVAVLYADVLRGEGESLNVQEEELIKHCAMALRKIASDKGVPAKGGAGLVIGIIAGVLAVLLLLGGVFTTLLWKRVESPAMRDDAMDGGYSNSLTNAAEAVSLS